MLSLTLILLVSVLCARVLCEEFVVDADSGMLTMAKSCLHVCNQGACLFKNCTYTRCPGGACHFIDSKYPSCDGKSLTYLVLSCSRFPQSTFTTPDHRRSLHIRAMYRSYMRWGQVYKAVKSIHAWSELKCLFYF